MKPSDQSETQCEHVYIHRKFFNLIWFVANDGFNRKCCNRKWISTFSAVEIQAFYNLFVYFLLSSYSSFNGLGCLWGVTNDFDIDSNALVYAILYCGFYFQLHIRVYITMHCVHKYILYT